MKKLVLVAAAAFFSSGVFADAYVAKGGKDSVTITDGDCPAPILALINPEYHDKFKQAFATLNGRSFTGCWIVADAETVYVQLDDGNSVLVPVKAFKKSHGV